MILLRHGQSTWNAAFTETRIDPGIPDAPLTALGRAQAEQAAESLAGKRLERILVSPYTRALQTAAPIARRLGLALVVHAGVRERYAFSCDVGSQRARLRARFPDYDFSALDEVWWPQAEEPAHQVVARAGLFRAEMAALPDWERTLVVAHWGFIMSLTGRSLKNGEWLRYDPTTPPPAEISWRP